MAVIIPVHNAEHWLEECLQSVYCQQFSGTLEISIFNDGSTDNSKEMIERWKEMFASRNIQMVIGSHSDENPRGVGYAKNRAVEQSHGKYLCFLDADDIMDEERVHVQYEAAKAHPASIIGCRFHREPVGSTERFTRWANTLTQEQLHTQAFTSHGPTVIMPTWMCKRGVYRLVGGFDEGGKGVPEDLIFFYRHLELGGGLHRVDRDLLTYRYHADAATFSITEETIWRLRVSFLEKQVLSKWETFTIWNAGKQGRRLYRSLTDSCRNKVVAFCDVDDKKINKGCYIYEESKEKPKPKVAIHHFRDAQPPLIICVKMDLTGGEFEKNLSSLNLTEGKDFYHFN